MSSSALCKSLLNKEMIQILREIQSGDWKCIKDFRQNHPSVHYSELIYSKTGDNVLHLAARLGRIQLILYLLNNYKPQVVDLQNNDDKTPLHEAAQFAQLDSVNILIKYGANVNALKRSDWTPLMLACVKITCEKVNLEIVNILLGNGALVNCKNKDGWSAFHLLCREAAPNIMKVLFYNGADVHQVTKNGRTPFHIACLHSNIDALKILLDNAADVNTKDFSQNTPLHDAVLGGSIDIIDLLMQHGADAFAVNSSDFTILHLAASVSDLITLKHILVYCNLPVNITNRNGLTPLHCAAKSQRMQAYKFLMGYGANETLADKFGRRPSDYLKSPISTC